MDKQDKGQNPGAGHLSERSGYATPGADEIIESSSRAVPSPSRTSEERLQGPKPVIESINETPGDANPALVETVGVEEGRLPTAEALRTREAAEEEHLKAAQAQAYQDQGLGATPGEFEQVDTGRPNWPDERLQAPMEYMESPRADSSLMSAGVGGAPDVFDINFKGRVDATMDRDSTQAAAQESRSGLAPTGYSPEEDKYERREMERPTEPSDLDRTAPGMINLPPRDKGDDE